MSKALLWPAVVVALVLVVGFVLLDVSGHDTGEYVVFVSGPLVSSVVGFVLAKRVSAIQRVTDVVAHQTNSLLSTRLNHIDEAIAEATGGETVAPTTTVSTTLPDQLT